MFALIRKRKDVGESVKWGNMAVKEQCELMWKVDCISGGKTVDILVASDISLLSHHLLSQ